MINISTLDGQIAMKCLTTDSSFSKKKVDLATEQSGESLEEQLSVIGSSFITSSTCDWYAVGNDYEII